MEVCLQTRIGITLEISNKQSVMYSKKVDLDLELVFTIGEYHQRRFYPFVVQLCVATSFTMSFNSIDIYRVENCGG